MRSRLFVVASVLFCLALPLIATGAEDARPLAEHPSFGPMSAEWAERMELFDVPGAAIAIVEGDRTWVGAWGTRDGEGRPVDGETMFYIASITKTYLATLLAQMAEEDLLSLDDPVRKHLPRFTLPDEEASASITLRDLLAHRPGIRSREIVLLDAYTGEITEERYWHWLARAEVAGETRYSNVHYTLAGRVVEALAGKDWRDALDERLLAPAGLRRTTGYASRLYGDENAALPLRREAEGWEAVDQRKTDRTMHAAGGLGTSARDAARWMRLHLGKGRLEERLFSEDTAREISAEHSTHEPEGSLRIMRGFGLGWQRGTFNEVPFLAHGGGYTGASAYMAIFPEQEAGIAILINAGGFARGWGAAVAVDAFEAFTESKAEWSPWERFTPQVAKRKAEQEAEAKPEDGGSAKPELSRPIGLYVGSFHNPWFGVLHLEREGEALALRLGDAPQETLPGGVDTLRLPGVSDPPATLHLRVGEHGRVEGVTLVGEGLGEVDFVR